MITRLLAPLALLLMLAACDEAPVAAPPVPVQISEDSTGYFCGMLLQEHVGPKGQIHVAGKTAPLWFTSVRDTIAFTRMPGEAHGIVAIYVNDMSQVEDWRRAGEGGWIEATKAVYVVGSDRRGGMGAREAVPFGDEAAAARFAAAEGGKVVRLDEIPDSYVIGPAEADSGAKAMENMNHATN